MTDAGGGPKKGWRTRGGLYAATFRDVACPTDTDSAERALRRAVSLAREHGGQVCLIGGARSFAPHFLPKEGLDCAFGIDCTGLSGVVAVHARTEDDLGRGVLRVRARAGTSFAELISAVRPYGHFFPFSLPTSGAVTLGGALAANTHSRSSATYGGLFADHVLAVCLLTAAGGRHDLTAAGEGTWEDDLFRFVPGCLGALGLVTEMDLELLEIEPRVVEAEVVARRKADHLATLEDYLRCVSENRRPEGFVHEEGYGLVFFGHALSGASVVMGRRRVAETARPGKAMPLFSGSRSRAALVQGLAHRFPRVGQTIAASLLPEGKKFRSDYQRWALFQDSYDDATDRAREATGVWGALRAARLVDPFMTVVHQAWVTPTEGVRDFMRAHFALLSEPRFSALVPRVEFQDLLPLPEGRWPMSPNLACARGAHCFALSFALRKERPELTRLARDYCAELSERVAPFGSRVQLIKQLHVEAELLQESYREPLAELGRLRARVDPEGLIGSRTLAKLGF